MRKFLCILIAALLLMIFGSGCVLVEKSSGIFDYTGADARFELSFQSDSGDVVCFVTRVGDKISLRVTSPKEMESFSLEIAGGNCVITSTAEPLPVSSGASRGLTSLFDVLYRGDNGVENIKKSSDGLSTVVTYSDGGVVLGEDNLPVAVMAKGMNGQLRGAVITWYSTVPEQQ